MTTDIGNIFAIEAAKSAAKLVIEQVQRVFDRSLSEGERDDITTRLSSHLVRVANWASNYSFLGLNSPKDSKEDTITLRFSTTSRRYQGKSSKLRAEVAEGTFLTDHSSVVILGDPGAGKTTTLKRLALTLLTSDRTAQDDVYQFPILVTLKDLPKSRYLSEEIASIFGFQFTKKLRENVDDDKQFGNRRRNRGDYEILVGSEPIEDAVSQALNDSRALLLIDGLDELELEQRDSVEREIEAINSRLTTSKVILSCRSGDFNSSFSGFNVFEISPLNRNEISQISSIWLSDPDKFLHLLDLTPYADIVDRPLLLTFLLYLYDNDGELPEQPSLVYRKVVYRLLRDWDAERKIKRVSKYANFDPDRKIDFLSELSYFLTYELKGKFFSANTFSHAYKQICPSFNLPPHEDLAVARELETHTGIVVASGFERFEFAHLSVQEYLCANYISRSPYPDHLKVYLTEYPAPVAVACALSSDPSMFFSEMLNRHIAEKFRDPHSTLFSYAKDEPRQLVLDLFGVNTAVALKSFLARLRIERPYFKATAEFGDSVICLFAFYYRRFTRGVDSEMVDFLALPGVLSSIGSALNRGPEKQIGKVTNRTVAINIDQWFRDAYEKVAGPWNFTSEKQSILPLALLPLEVVEECSHQRARRDLDPTMSERVTSTLGSSPFCLLDQGGHRFSAEGKCKACGFDKQLEYKRYRKWKGKKKVASGSSEP